jgi:hypothetical protein
VSNLTAEVDRIKREVLASQGKISPGRRLLFDEFFQALDRVFAARKIIESDGLTVKSDRSGLIRPNAACRLEQEALSRLLKLAKLLRLEWDSFVDGGLTI